MKKKSILVTLLVVSILGALVLFRLGPIVYQTYSNRAMARELIEKKATVKEITAVFRERTIVYDGYERLPRKLQTDVPEELRGDWLFYYFGQEGLPSYWSFYVVAEKEDKNILWGKVRDRP